MRPAESGQPHSQEEGQATPARPPAEAPEQGREQRKPGELWTIVCTVASPEGMGEWA